MGACTACFFADSLLLLFHDSELCGADASAVDTRTKLSRSFFWHGMEHDVHRWVASCSVCRLVRLSTASTPDARMELYDRPFRIRGIGDLGPISPPSDGNSCSLHAVRALSHYVWLRAPPDNGAETWVHFFAEQVMFDLAGFVLVLRSDRGAAFVSEVVEQINKPVGTDRSFGSSYRAQSRGVVDAWHQIVERTFASYPGSHLERWARRTPLAQWCMRATPLASRGNRSRAKSSQACFRRGRPTRSSDVLNPGRRSRWN